ncbi:MAG TPA: hypothetical protein VFW53_08680 [Gallionella sp.]|nr:hypothetical protein [Gallionella sp.]
MGNLKKIVTLTALALSLNSIAPALAGTGNNGTCAVDPAWFSDGRISAPKPEDFPLNPSNCDFHQISWHYFLWLTEKMPDGHLRFESMYSEQAIDPKTPDAINKDLHLVFQAGSLGILVNPDGRASYTSIMINKTYRDFVLDNKLYDPETLQKFPATTSFPVGSLSLKASWRIVGKGEKVGNAYTRKADVVLLDNVNGKVNFPNNKKIAKDVEVALVGLHIAIVTQHHPEAIWATFEHLDNAPNMFPGLPQDQAVSEKDYTFYRAQASGKDIPASACNLNNASLLSIDVKTQRLSPTTQVCRQYPYGGGKSSNQNNIEAINRSAMLQLSSNSVWRNYSEIGAVWLLGSDALVPNWNPNLKTDPAITGSVTLSSSIIETFTQNVVSQNNCFSCHNTMALTDTPDDRNILSGKNVNTSHIVLQRYVKGAVVNR